MSATAFERIIDKLENVKVTHNGTQARAKCPAHAGDSDTSLAIRRVEGKALIHCFADCPVDDVLASLEMRRSDLYDDGNGYTYTYPDGSNVHRSYTRDGKKRFYQSGNTGSGGTATTLYRADAVEAAKLAGTTIWFAEGEDDVHALEAIGLVAVTARGGAGNVHKCDLTPLHGANVVVVVDKDKAGDKRAATISNMLSSKAKLAWVQAKTGKDAADHIAAGHGIADFEQYIFPTDEAPDVDQPTQTRYDQLMLACLDSKGLRNIPSPLPIIDNYLFRDSLAWIGGKPGHCKSFVAAEMACCVGTGRDWFGNPVKQGKVLYLIAEGASGFSDRIETWEEYYGTDATNVTFLPVPIQFKADVD